MKTTILPEILKEAKDAGCENDMQIHGYLCAEVSRLRHKENKVTDPNHDPVLHPSHYCSHPSGVECIEVTRDMSFNIGNSFKYLYRCDKKENMVQDIRKAIFYIEDEIKRREALRWKFLREDPFYRPHIDGAAPIRAVLDSERRFGGHLCWALDRLYTAHARPRSVETSLKPALETLNHILKIWT